MHGKYVKGTKEIDVVIVICNNRGVLLIES